MFAKSDGDYAIRKICGSYLKSNFWLLSGKFAIRHYLETSGRRRSFKFSFLPWKILLNRNSERLIFFKHKFVDCAEGGADFDIFFCFFRAKSDILDDMCNLIRLNVLCLCAEKKNFHFLGPTGGMETDFKRFSCISILTSSCWWLLI